MTHSERSQLNRLYSLYLRLEGAQTEVKYMKKEIADLENAIRYYQKRLSTASIKANDLQRLYEKLDGRKELRRLKHVELVARRRSAGRVNQLCRRTA